MSDKSFSATDAKDVVSYFMAKAKLPASPSTYARTTQQVKILLQGGYTKEEIIACINYLIDVRAVEVYSFGYINSSISSILKTATKHYNAILAQKQVSEMTFETSREVMEKDETTSRNREKAGRFGSESGFRKKFDFNMHTESREDN
jgi:hypothetical protein